ncbi:hypothetical protein ACFX19_042575 [Malus domestica]
MVIHHFRELERLIEAFQLFSGHKSGFHTDFHTSSGFQTRDLQFLILKKSRNPSFTTGPRSTNMNDLYNRSL